MRDYDPTTGRYIQADPLGLIDGASVYGYARQNPGRYIDVRGENPGAIVVGGGIAIGKGISAYNKIDKARKAAAAARAAARAAAAGTDNQCEDPCKEEKDRLNRAKNSQKGVKQCSVADHKATLEMKLQIFFELLRAREEAALCIGDADPTHMDQIRDIKKVVHECMQLLGL